jgi:hypothetical protein
MKRILITITVFALCLVSYGQKITELTESTAVGQTSLLITREGAAGNLLRRITVANLFSGRTLGGTTIVSTTLNPDTNDGATLGTASAAWSDLFLANDGVINFGGDNATISGNGTKITIGGPVDFDFGVGDLLINGNLLLTTPDVDISMAEIGALDGATSNIQTQLNDTTDFDTEELTGAVLWTVGDTSVTAIVGRMVFKTSDTHLYLCTKLTAKKWYRIVLLGD